MGSLVFSVDVEGAWGESAPRYPGRRLPARRECAWLLEAARRTDTVLTVAAVGHLYLEACQGHPKLGREVNAQDPKASEAEAPGHYMASVLGAFRDAGHEMAVHGFVHTPYTRLTEKEAERDLAAARLAAFRFGARPKTFIFPRNEIAHLRVLKKQGFTHYASNPPPRHLLLNRAPALHLPQPAREHTTGLVDVPRTLYLDRDRARDRLRARALFLQARALKQVVHVWTHPWNLKNAAFARHIEAVMRAAKNAGLEPAALSSLRPRA